MEFPFLTSREWGARSQYEATRRWFSLPRAAPRDSVMPTLIPIDLSDDLLEDNRKLLAEVRRLHADERPPDDSPRVIADLELERTRLEGELAQIRTDLGVFRTRAESAVEWSTRLQTQLDQCQTELKIEREKVEAADREIGRLKADHQVMPAQIEEAAASAKESKARLEICERELAAARKHVDVVPEPRGDLLNEIRTLKKVIESTQHDLVERKSQLDACRDELRWWKNSQK
jgi:chromosome segregation ATPase